MILRALLVVLLAVASVATAAAQCRVGASFEHALAGAGQHHNAMGHHGKGDGAKAPRVCDTMVQATAPHAPAVAPSLTSIAVATMVVATELPRPLSTMRRAHRPPDRSRHFKDIYARTGRLLV